MIVMGINPVVTTSTNAMMIVLTSSTVAIIFVTTGLVPWSYAIFYFLVCLVGAIFGKLKIDRYIKRTGRASLLILILASIVLFASIGFFVIMLTGLADNSWCLKGFNEFCRISSNDSAECPISRLLSEIDIGSRFAKYSY